MAPIEQHWEHLRGLLAPHNLTTDQLAFCREMFFSGALSLLSILADMNSPQISDQEFNARLEALFKEAAQGVMARYCKGPCVHTHASASSRRH